MAEFDDDEFPNDFDGLDFDNIPELQAPTISTVTPVSSSTATEGIVLTASASPAQSTGSNVVEYMDPTFLAALDAMESRALSNIRQDFQTVNSPKGVGASTPNPIHDSIRSSESLYDTRKGKRKAEPSEDMDVRAMLSGYEAELTCPICCDLLVAAHVANPCGHTCCGQCGYEWLAQSKCGPTCATCRSNLSPRKPLLPNFTVEGFVQRHLQMLAKSGRPEWQQRGYKTIEWNKRLESWKQQANARAAKEKLKEPARTRRRLSHYYDDFEYEPGWVDDEGMLVEADGVIPRVTRRRGRTRQ